MAERLSGMPQRSSRVKKEDSGYLEPISQSQRSRIWFKKKGTAIATSIRVEMQYSSFILLQAYRLKQGTRPLFDFNIKDLKGKFEGCMSALSGEYSAVVSLKHFNFQLSEWEHVIEPFNLSLTLDQMPDELVSLKLASQRYKWHLHC
jgi:hypothetical protein